MCKIENLSLLGKLIAPTFSLSYTSYSVHVKIHKKQILDELFAYGVQYTTYLWPNGQENQVQNLH